MVADRVARLARGTSWVLAVAILGCQAAPTSPISSSAASSTPTATAATVTPAAARPSPTPTAGLSTPPPSGSPVGGIYSATITGVVSPALADIPPRVWVPNERGGKVVVIDPATFEIVDRLEVGAYPEHVTPSWNGQVLYVNNMNSDSMSIIDPRSGTITGEVRVPAPYNLYFTPDGTRAIVVADMLRGAPEDENGLRFYSYPAFEELAFVPVPWAGADHLDFSADGRRLFLSCEYSARVVVVDVESMEIEKTIVVGGFPTDVRLSPDGTRVFVANQLEHGLTVIDAGSGDIVDFVKLAKGSHGLALSRDARALYVTNRIAGSVSVIDVETFAVLATWSIGGSPDMIAVSADGSQLWISNRWDRTVVVLDSADGRIIRTIETGAYPHGLAFWPLPGRFSLGHNGNMR